MRSFLTTRHVTFASLTIAAMALGGGAHAVTEAVYRYSTPQTGYLTLPAAAFSEPTNGVPYNNHGTSFEASNGACFSAPVNLPHGAKMTRLVMWYKKSDGTSVNSGILRQVVSEETAEYVAMLPHTVDTGGAIGSVGVNITDTSKQTVNNARYAYFIFRCLTDQERSFGARITYTYRTAGD